MLCQLGSGITREIVDECDGQLQAELSQRIGEAIPLGFPCETDTAQVYAFDSGVTGTARQWASLVGDAGRKQQLEAFLRSKEL